MARLLVALFALLVVVVASGRTAFAQSGPPVVLTTLSYGPDPAHFLDLYTPRRPPPEPVPIVVLAHGGLWQGGFPGELADLCRRIVREREAHACASIQYRTSQDLGGVCTPPGLDVYLEQVDDLARAVAWLQDAAATHGLDPDRVYVGGHSAGGHLAHVLNLRWPALGRACARPGGCAPPVGAIGIEGIYDVAGWDAWQAVRWSGDFDCATRQAFGHASVPGPGCEDAALGVSCWAAGSPTALAQRADTLPVAPVGAVLIVQSPQDDWVDFQGALDFEAALRAAFPGRPVRAVTNGSCGAGQHDAVLLDPALSLCLLDFVDDTSGGRAVPGLSVAAWLALAAAVLATGLGRLRRSTG